LLVIASFLLVSIAASLIWSGKQRSMKR
jgi:tellurite resistance protein TerC